MKGKEQKVRGGTVVGFVAEEKPAEEPKPKRTTKKKTGGE